MSGMRPDIYISADIEADGPVPGPYSMLAFGLAVAGRFDAKIFNAATPGAETFYRELAPISDQSEPDALSVSGLDRGRLIHEGDRPPAAMDAAAAWINEVANDHRPVLVAWPLSYDWLFLQWYFLRFASQGSPFGFSSGIDMKTLFWRHSGRVLDAAGKEDLPIDLRPNAQHTHNALDDAVEQAEIFVRLWNAGAAGGSDGPTPRSPDRRPRRS
jgi:hypothetical protein